MLFSRRLALGLAVACTFALPAIAAEGPTEIELFFPVQVDGKLARDMGTLIKEFDDTHPDIKATAVYTGSYDDTMIKTRAAIKAGKPPAAVIMSANFLLDMQIENELTNLDGLIGADGTTKQQFLGQFFPALQGNAVINGSVYGVPFQNSTPLLYINADHAKEAGLDPNKPPQTWAELTDWAKKLTKRDGDKVTRWGIEIPCVYDYCGWMMETLTMSNGGRYYNEEFGGEVYYDTPSMLGALTWWSDLVAKHKVHPPGALAGPAVSTAFISGNASMIMLSTGSLTYVRDNAKFPYKVAFIPRNVRNAVPIGGASLIIPTGLEADKQKAAWTLIKWLTSPEKSAWWSRATGYFAPNMGAYKTPDMVEFLNKNPDAKIAVEQLDVAKPWFATYKTVPVRKTLEDEVELVLNGKKQPKEALVTAQKAADELLKPYNAETTLKLP